MNRLVLPTLALFAITLATAPASASPLDNICKLRWEGSADLGSTVVLLRTDQGEYGILHWMPNSNAQSVNEGSLHFSGACGLLYVTDPIEDLIAYMQCVTNAENQQCEFPTLDP